MQPLHWPKANNNNKNPSYPMFRQTIADGPNNSPPAVVVDKILLATYLSVVYDYFRATVVGLSSYKGKCMAPEHKTLPDSTKKHHQLLS